MGSSSFRTWPSKNIFPALYILPLPTTETWLFHADTQALSQFICDSCPDSLGEEVKTFLCIDTFRLCDSSPICLTSTFANVKSLFWPLSLWASYWIIPYLFSLSLSLSHTHTHTHNQSTLPLCKNHHSFSKNFLFSQSPLWFSIFWKVSLSLHQETSDFNKPIIPVLGPPMVKYA
jgi:hypothetical protein